MARFVMANGQPPRHRLRGLNVECGFCCFRLGDRHVAASGQGPPRPRRRESLSEDGHAGAIRRFEREGRALLIEPDLICVEDAVERALKSQVLRRPDLQFASARHAPDAVGEPQRKVKVVTGKHDPALALARETPKERHHANAAWKIEKSGDLVEEQKFRALREGPRNHHFLALAVAQVADEPLGEGSGVDEMQAFRDDPFVFVREFPKPTGMGMTARGDEFIDPQGRRRHSFSHNDADHLRALAGRHGVELAAVDGDGAADPRLQSGQRP